MKIIHVINSLEIGGAEMMLLKLLNSGIYSNDEILILVLTKNTVLTEKIRKLGFNVEHFNFSKNFYIFREAIKFYKRIKIFSPDIVQSWLYQANLISGLSCFFLKIKNIWSIRQTSLDSKHNKISTLICAKFCAFLSKKIPYYIIYNSKSSKKNHVDFGYYDKKSFIIYNGFDLLEYKKYKQKKISLSYNINFKHPIIGFIARFDVQKNHVGFFEIAEKVVKIIPNTNFILAGRNVDEDNEILVKIREEKKLKQNIFFLGERRDIPELLNMLDLLILPSKSEGFPNVIGEAMACELPCIASDVGAVKEIIGDTGKVVKSDDIKKFADEIINFLNLSKRERLKIGKNARNRIKNNFDIRNISEEFKILIKRAVKEIRNGQN